MTNWYLTARSIELGIGSRLLASGLGHLFLGRWGDRAMFAFVVDQPDVARPILERKA